MLQLNVVLYFQDALVFFIWIEEFWTVLGAIFCIRKEFIFSVGEPFEKDLCAGFESTLQFANYLVCFLHVEAFNFDRWWLIRWVRGHVRRGCFDTCLDAETRQEWNWDVLWFFFDIDTRLLFFYRCRCNSHYQFVIIILSSLMLDLDNLLIIFMWR